MADLNINYALRPNKNIERKLIVETLRGLAPCFDVSTYRYIGFGSVWFIDFTLIHKSLLIHDMISIEKDLSRESRAKFNKPFECIRVEAGDSTTILPLIELGEKRSIVWLDYEKGLSGPVLEDTEIVCERLLSGSIVIATINASLGQLNISDEHGHKLTEEQALRFYCRDLVPTPLPPEALTVRQFPLFLAGILLAHLLRATRKSGRTERFYPIFNFYYKDGAAMVTVGGMIANEADRGLLESCRLPEKHECHSTKGQYAIDAPHMTAKEKLVFDQILPKSTPILVSDLDHAGFKMAQHQIASYQKLYRHYPLFTELNM